MPDVTVIVAGPFPPPVHGAAIITEAFSCRLQHQATVIRLDIGPGATSNRWRYHLTRARRVAAGVGTVFRHRRTAWRYLYISVAGGPGIVYNVILTLVARALGYQILLHHHSFAYLTRRRFLVSALVAVSGDQATHLALCPLMATRLGEIYRPRKVVALSNAWWLEPAARPDSSRPERLRIGHLSSLCHTKGLAEVVAVYQLLRDRSRDVTLTLAGPSVCPIADDILATVAGDGGIRWVGPVGGAAKADFFQKIDIFLFPTRYPNEAEPLVVYEALAAGTPVLAVKRGCIGDQLDQVAGRTFPAGSFVQQAADAIEAFLTDPVLLDQARQRAFDLANSNYARGQDQMAAVLANIGR